MNTFKHHTFRCHFCLLGLVLFNYIVRLLSGWSLNYDIVFVLKLLVYVSGILLFFFHLKPLKKITVYYFYYILTAVSGALFWLGGSFIFGIILFISIFPFNYDTTKYKSTDLILHSSSVGILGACCDYVVTKPRLHLFQKKIGSVHIEEPDLSNSKIIVEGDSLKIVNHSVMMIPIEK